MLKTSESQVLQRLDEWRREGPLPEFVDFYGKVLHIQAKAREELLSSQGELPAPPFSPALIEERLTQGTPLLTWDDLRLDWKQLESVFLQIARIMVEDSPDSLRKLDRFQEIAPHLPELVKFWYQGSSLDSYAEASGLEAEELLFVTQAALKPFLKLYAEFLLPKVDQESWRRGYCPICGGKPDFAYLDKEVGSRWLSCSRCDAQWLFQRLECPFCGTQNQNALAYFTDDEGLYRLYTCEECQSYIKAIDLRKTDSEVLLPLERLITVDLDRQAEEAGYKANWTASTPFGLALSNTTTMV